MKDWINFLLFPTLGLLSILIFFGIINGFLPSLDSFVIGYINNASDVGIYNVALLILGFMLFVPTLFIRLFLLSD